MRLLDLFSGIGGFSLGLERAGFHTVAFCEVSPICRHLLNHHWPEVPCYDDVQTLTAERLAADGIVVDAICGGFPCQDISLAGAGAGIAGSRSGLWKEYWRLISELRPRFVFVENVSALLSRGLGVVLGDLAALGYDAWWDCIPAAAVGAPHRRDRLWLMAYPNSIRFRGERLTGLVREAAQNAGEAWEREWLRSNAQSSSEAMANASGSGLSDHQRCSARAKCDWSGALDGSCGPSRRHYGWSIEPDVGRVAHGVPARVNRLHGLGNAVVPQIPEILGRAALAAMEAA